jgi:hypothetical protein
MAAMPSRDDLLDRIGTRIETYQETDQPAIVLDRTALLEACLLMDVAFLTGAEATDQLVNPAFGSAGGVILDPEAVRTLAWFHLSRYQAAEHRPGYDGSEDFGADDIEACLKYFAVLAGVDRGAVPDEMLEMVDALGAGDPELTEIGGPKIWSCMAAVLTRAEPSLGVENAHLARRMLRTAIALTPPGDERLNDFRLRINTIEALAGI